MSHEVKKTSVEVYTRQHEFYAEQTAVALQFPIKLILTLNAAAVAASLLLVREAIGTDTETAIVAAVRCGFWVFGGGIASVLAASWCQWQLYSKIMHRKRRLLARALTASDWGRAMSPFVDEPWPWDKTRLHGWCFFFVVVSFVLFLAGTYLVASGF